jgi:hypothetical protein
MPATPTVWEHKQKPSNTKITTTLFPVSCNKRPKSNIIKPPKPNNIKYETEELEIRTLGFIGLN